MVVEELKHESAPSHTIEAPFAYLYLATPTVAPSQNGSDKIGRMYGSTGYMYAVVLHTS